MLQLLIRWIAAPLARLLYRPVVTGTEYLPREGPVIIAANHLSAIDTAVIGLVAPRPVVFLGKVEYFTGPGLRGRLMASFVRALGFVPVDRDNAHAAVSSLAVASRVLNAGEVFAIYPEGTRSLDGKLYKGHTGVAQLALVSGAPVVPVAITGTDRVLPVDRKIPRIAPISVRFGRPIDFGRYTGLEASPAIRRAVTDEIMYAIMELSGQTYDDRYLRYPGQAA